MVAAFNFPWQLSSCHCHYPLLSPSKPSPIAISKLPPPPYDHYLLTIDDLPLWVIGSRQQVAIWFLTSRRHMMWESHHYSPCLTTYELLTSKFQLPSEPLPIRRTINGLASPSAFSMPLYHVRLVWKIYTLDCGIPRYELA